MPCATIPDLLTVRNALGCSVYDRFEPRESSVLEFHPAGQHPPAYDLWMAEWLSVALAFYFSRPRPTASDPDDF